MDEIKHYWFKMFIWLRFRFKSWESFLWTQNKYIKKTIQNGYYLSKSKQLIVNRNLPNNLSIEPGTNAKTQRNDPPTNRNRNRVTRRATRLRKEETLRKASQKADPLQRQQRHSQRAFGQLQQRNQRKVLFFSVQIGVEKRAT